MNPCPKERQISRETESTLACFYQACNESMTLSILETSLPRQRSHDTLSPYGVFTLADTDTDTDTDKMGLQPICICVGVGVSVGVGQCEHSISSRHFSPKQNGSSVTAPAGYINTTERSKSDLTLEIRIWFSRLYALFTLNFWVYVFLWSLPSNANIKYEHHHLLK